MLRREFYDMKVVLIDKQWKLINCSSPFSHKSMRLGLATRIQVLLISPSLGTYVHQVVYQWLIIRYLSSPGSEIHQYWTVTIVTYV